MTFAALDIETVPDEMLIEQFPSDLLPQPKLGNLKDPKKIEMKIKEWEATERDKAMSLDPFFAQNAAYSLYFGDGKKASECGENEREMLSKLLLFLTKRSPFTIITANGKGFDLPVIMTRMLKHELLSWHDAGTIRRNYMGRYAEFHIDLCEHFTQPNNRAIGRSLDFMATYALAERKVGSGSEVLTWWREKQFDQIEKYCLSDTINTWRVAKWARLIP